MIRIAPAGPVVHFGPVVQEALWWCELPADRSRGDSLDHQEAGDDGVYTGGDGANGVGVAGVDADGFGGDVSGASAH